MDTANKIGPHGANPRDAIAFVQGEVNRRVGDATNTLRTHERGLEAAEAGERSIADVFVDAAGGGSQASRDLHGTVTERGLVPITREKNTRYDAIDPDRNVMRDVEPMVALANDIAIQVEEIRHALRRDMIHEQLIHDIRGMARRTEERTVTSPLLDETGQPITRTETVEAGGTGQMSFGAMNDMRAGLASAAAAARKAQQYRLAESLDRFRAQINRESRALADEGGPAGNRARAADEFYRDEFTPVWNAGPGDEATRFR